MAENFWQNKRVILTGGAGFLGSFVTEKLNATRRDGYFYPAHRRLQFS